MKSGRLDKRLLVVGFDALDHEVFTEHNELGLEVHRLFSPVPVTGPAWTSMYTGASIKAHGVRDVHGRSGRHRIVRWSRWLDRLAWGVRDGCVRLGWKDPVETYRTPADTPATYFWDTLTEAGLSTKLVNLPVTWPAHRIDGIYIAGIPLPRSGRRWVYPASVRKQLPDDYWEMCDIVNWFEDLLRDGVAVWRPHAKEWGMERLLDRTRRLSYRMIDFFNSLDACDVNMIQFPFVDRVGHVFGINEETIGPTYGLVNELLRYVWDEHSDDYDLMVVSDHGMQGTDHTHGGVLAQTGGVFDGSSVEDARTYDVSPTILHYCGVPSGAAVQALGRGGNRERATESEGEAEEAEQIKERLRQIGYL
jgi:hypothetical protein